MSKSLVEKYQQMLAEDPGSLVFVELAKALLDRGDAAEAVDVCRKGVENHPDSIVGRVLWGKALINCGKAADAMEQFDAAIAIERDNPYAYNLIGEVLLHKGLYRSAVPILKKAVALQPDDGRVRQWLEHAQRAVGGGGAPPPGTDPSAAPTQVDLSAYTPSADTVPGISDVFQSLTARTGGQPKSNGKARGTVDVTPSGEQVVSGLSGEFKTLSATSPQLVPPGEPLAAAPAAAPAAAGLMPDLPAMAASGAASGASLSVAIGSGEPSASPRPLAPPPLPPGGKRGGLLSDLPEEPVPGPHSDELPSVVIAQEAAEDIAREYERELRAKLLATPPPTFWRKYWVPVVAGSAIAVVAAIAFGVYIHTRREHRGTDLIALRSQAYRALALDTPTGYRHAIELAERALDLAEGDVDSQSAVAYSEAALFRQFGREPGRKARAMKLLPFAQEKHAGLALSAAFFTADDPTSVEAAKVALLGAKPATLPAGFERAQVFSLGGRLLLAAAKPEEALERFKTALEADPGHVPTLAALGEYYLAQGEPEQAMKFFSLAKAASPEHVPALLGLLSAKLALGRQADDPSAELTQAKAALAAAQKASAPWPAEWQADLMLAEGRLLGSKGQTADAVAMLSQGAFDHGARAADFYAALAQVEAAAGNYDKAEGALVKAIERRPNDLGLKEELARSLIAQGRPQEALKRTEGSPDRRVRIVRGLALLELGQLGKARDELAGTRRADKVPTEAAVYLARIDAAQGNRELALQVLENVVKAFPKRSAARVALGEVYEDLGREQDAIAQYTAAAEDQRDWEGACSLGRLHLKAGRYAEARVQLTTAVARNKHHREARVGLGEAVLALGEPAKAQAELSSALALGPSAAAHRALSRSWLVVDDLPQARRHFTEARRLEPRNPELASLALSIAFLAGDSTQSVKSLERTAKAAAKNAAVQCNAGEWLIKAGEPGVARNVFDAALKGSPDSIRARLGRVQALLALSPKAALKEADALVDLSEKASPDPKEPSFTPAERARAMALRSRALLANGDKKRALQDAKQAVKLLDASLDAHYALALAASATQDNEQALRELKRVVALEPAFAEARLALGLALAHDAANAPAALTEVRAYLRIAPKGPDSAGARKIEGQLAKLVQDRGA